MGDSLKQDKHIFNIFKRPVQEPGLRISYKSECQPSVLESGGESGAKKEKPPAGSRRGLSWG